MDYFSITKGFFISFIAVIGLLSFIFHITIDNYTTVQVLLFIGYTIVGCTERIIKAIWNSKGVNYD